MGTTHHKVWSRGKKKLTPEQLKKAKDLQKTRVKITNLVARRPEINKSCVICGKPGHILHNKQNPYFISFICDECSKDSNNIRVAESKRFDLRDRINKYNTSVSNFSDKDIKNIIEGYLKITNILSISEYCSKLHISRHQFNLCIDKYSDLTNKNNIHALIKSKTNNLRMNKLNKISNLPM